MRIKLLCIAITVLALILCACGNDSESGKSEASSATPDGAESTTRDSSATPDEPTTEHVLDQNEIAVQKVLLLAEQQLKSQSKQLDVEELFQTPELPTGCESVALTAALNYLGYDIGKTEIADNYMIYDDDMFWGYVGDPYSNNGAGIFPPGLTNTANLFFETNGGNYSAVNTMDYSLDELYRLVDSNCPVLVWTTMGFYEPNVIDTGYYYGEKEYLWYDNEHCMLLTGYDLKEKTVSFMDPLEGSVSCDADDFEAIYNEIGKLSMTIVKLEKE